MILMGGLLHDGRVRKEINSLSGHGFDVTILTMPQSPEDGAGLHDVSVDEIFLSSRRLSIGFVGLLFKYLEFVLRAFSRARRVKADVYHAHDLPTLLPAYLASRMTGGRLIYDAHELFTERGVAFSDNRGWKLLERWLIKKVDGLLTTNESRAEIMYTEYGAKVRPIPLYNCPPNLPMSGNSDILKTVVVQAIPACRHIVLYQGAISAGRHCEELIDAAKYVADETVIVFLGYGSPDTYIGELKQRASDIGVADKVYFHPPVPNDQIVDYSSSADIGAVFYRAHCRNNYYCASNKLFDFLMVGRPIIGTDIPGVNEIVAGRDVGLTVDTGDPVQIGQAINRILADHEDYEQMRENARRMAREEFNWQRQEQKLLALYEDLLEPDAVTA